MMPKSIENQLKYAKYIGVRWDYMLKYSFYIRCVNGWMRCELLV